MTTILLMLIIFNNNNVKSGGRGDGGTRHSRKSYRGQIDQARSEKIHKKKKNVQSV